MVKGGVVLLGDGWFLEASELERRLIPEFLIFKMGFILPLYEYDEYDEAYREDPMSKCLENCDLPPFLPPSLLPPAFLPSLSLAPSLFRGSYWKKESILFILNA